MVADDLGDRCEAKPGSGRARREKGLEQPLGYFFSEAGASIADGDASIGARLQFSATEDARGHKMLRIHRDFDASRFPHCLHRVTAQVDDDLLQLRRLA